MKDFSRFLTLFTCFNLLKLCVKSCQHSVICWMEKFFFKLFFLYSFWTITILPSIKILLNSFVYTKKSHGNLSYALLKKLLLARLNFISKLRGKKQASHVILLCLAWSQPSAKKKKAYSNMDILTFLAKNEIFLSCSHK